MSGVQRFTRGRTCPVCGGAESDSRHQGARCHGYISSDNLFVHCTREEHTNGAELPYCPTSQTWAHKLNGICRCGVEHGPALERPKRSPSQRPTQQEAAYSYHDADHRLLFEVVRLRYQDTGEKTFRQRRRGPDGQWIWDLKGVEPVLYRLPELIGADPSEWVFIVEGEKDVERLRNHGAVATCNSGGAGKWREAYAEPLRGRRVAIVPDNDQVGREHAQAVARSLSGAGVEVRVVELPDLPEKGDASDFLDARRTLADLLVLVEAAPAWASRGEVIGDVRGEEPEESNESETDPHRLARLYLGSTAHHAGPTLVYWRGEWWRYLCGAFRAVPEKELRATLGPAIKAEFDKLNIRAVRGWYASGKDGSAPKPVAHKVTEQLKSNVLGNLAGLALLTSHAVHSAPAWISVNGPWPAREILPARNSLVHLPSLVAGLPCVTDPTPRYFSTWALDYDFEPDAPEPGEWTRFLESLWPEDRESIATLQEWWK